MKLVNIAELPISNSLSNTATVVTYDNSNVSLASLSNSFAAVSHTNHEYIVLNSLTADPISNNGSVWYRSDLSQLRGKIANKTVIISENADENIVALASNTTAGLAAVAEGEYFAVPLTSSIAVYRKLNNLAILIKSACKQILIPDNAPTSAAIISSATALQNNGASLKLILGKNYSSGNDATATLNNTIPDLAANNIMLTDTDNTVMSLMSTLYLANNLNVNLNVNTTFLRRFSTAFPLIGMKGTSSPSNKYSNIKWFNGKLVCDDDNYGGHMAVLGLDDSYFENLQILGHRPRNNGTGGGHGLRFYGNRNLINNAVVWSDTIATGTAGIRILCGVGNRVSNAKVKSGDDALQFCPGLDDNTSPFFNEITADSIYENCYVESCSKAIIAAMSSSVSNAIGSTGYIRNCSFKGIRGSYGTLAAFIANDAGNPAIIDQVDNILLQDISLYKGPISSINNSTNGIHIQSKWENSVRNVTLGNIIIDGSTNTGTKNALTIEGPGIIVHNAGPVKLTGSVRAVRMFNGASKAAIQGDFISAGEGDSDDTEDRHVIQIDSSASGSRLTLNNTARIYGVKTPTINGNVIPMSGIFIASNSFVDASAVEVYKAANVAANTRGVLVFANSYFSYDRLSSNCDIIYTGAGDVRRNASAIPMYSSTSIINDAITMPEATYLVVDTEAAASTDNLSSITAYSGMRIGQIITLRIANNARSVVVKHNSGNILLTNNADVTLSTTGDRLTLIYNGVNFRQIGASIGGGSLLPNNTIRITTSTNAGYNVTSLATRVLLDGPLTRSPTYTISTASAVVGDKIIFERNDSTAYTYTILHGTTNALLATLTKPGDWVELAFNGTSWEVTFYGLNFSSTTSGSVPASGGGTNNYLRADGTWSDPSGAQVPYLIPVSGEYIMATTGSGGASLGTQISAANRMDIYPFVPRITTTITGVAMNITAGAVGNAKIIIYDSDSLGRPNNLIYESTDMDTTNIATITATASLTLNKNNTYWIGIRTNSNPTYSTWPTAATPDINGGTPSTTARKVLRRILVYNTATPTTWGFTSSEANATQAPAIWLKV